MKDLVDWVVAMLALVTLYAFAAFVALQIIAWAFK